MRLNESALAKACAFLAGGSYLLCLVATLLFPKQTVWLFNAWFHGLDISVLPYQVGPVVMVVVGLITFTLAGWLMGFVLARIYNLSLK